MSAEWPPPGAVEARQQVERQYSLLGWAAACAATLDASRRTWRTLRTRMPLGDGRRTFVVPAIAITAAFLAGAWWLKSRTSHKTGRANP